MLFVTTEYISGKELEMLGMVTGSTIQSKNIGHDLGASLKTLVGGEIKTYTDMMENARGIATERMTASAAKMGADAVVGVKFSTSSIMQGASEVMAYGTAVRFR